MKRLATIALGWLLAGMPAPGLAAPAQCPFDIPVVTVPAGPHPSGFNWSGPIRPMGDPCLNGITVDPGSTKVWYVAAGKGLYITRTGGTSWEHPLTAAVLERALALAPDNVSEVYAGAGNTLLVSKDKGLHWKVLHTFPHTVTAVHVAPGGRVYVGLSWAGSAAPNGIFISLNKGVDWKASLFGRAFKNLICWDIARDPKDGTLFVGTEITPHPNPYKPPLFRSQNGGQTWTDVSGTIPWHVSSLQIRPGDGYVYALTEGSGLFGSANHGGSWLGPLLNDLTLQPAIGLRMDHKVPKRLFAGQQKTGGAFQGGAFVSVNAGRVFHPIGLKGATVSGFSLDGAGTHLFAAVYASGIYVSPVPATLGP